MRPDYCPIGGEPCQSGCATPCSTAKPDLIPHDPKHPLLQALKGCGHGRTWKEPCRECEIVGLHSEYGSAVRTVQRVRDRLRVLGAPMPGQTS